MNLYVFTSNNITNIWAGIGAGKWAVSKKQADNVGGARTKAAQLPIGAPGLIYCSATKAFTTPFLVASKPDQENEEQKVWSDPWLLPFRISPLGTPRKELHTDRISEVLSLPAGEPWNHVLGVSGAQAFSPSHIEDAVWERILLELMS